MWVNWAFHGWSHQFLYSKVVLNSLLVATGFEQIAFFNYGESDVADLEMHDSWHIAAGYPTVWVVEALKSSDDAESG